MKLIGPVPAFGPNAKFVSPAVKPAFVALWSRKPVSPRAASDQLRLSCDLYAATRYQYLVRCGTVVSVEVASAAVPAAGPTMNVVSPAVKAEFVALWIRK